MSQPPVIVIENLTKKFSGAYALKGIDLAIRQGEIYGIIGMSGAGKSTLMRCLTLLESPTSGRIFIQGEEITALSGKWLRKARRKIGMVFQHFNLFSSRTASENISYPMEIEGIPQEEQKKRVAELLSLVGLKGKGDAYPSQLSGGEKQRVAIARALATHPQVLLCDEATSALDPKTTRGILQLLMKLNKSLGLTILMITHEMQVIKEICTRVAVLENGKIVEEGNAVDLFSSPSHGTTKTFLQSLVHELPEEFLRKEAGKQLVRLSFKGGKAKEPVISRLIRTHPVDVNILLGGIDRVQSVTIGSLVVELSGTQEDMSKAIEFLESQGVSCEVIR